MADLDEILKRKRAKFRLEGNELRPEPVDLEAMIDGARRVTDLEKVWKNAVPGFVRELTIKQKGQLKHFATACGGYPRAAYVLAWVASNWDSFRHHSGAKHLTPNLSVLLWNAEAALRAACIDEPQEAVTEERTGIENQSVEETMSDEDREDYLALLKELE